MSSHKKIKRLQVKGRPSTAYSYFSFGPSETPVPLPHLPSWMLDTPMYSKVPMVPAPKGKIVLYTTGLGKKLHHTLSELEFDPNPQELSTEYHSLHDKHLRSYYCKPTKISRLIRNGFITPEGKVICTLKEFNDYQQHLKRVRLEKNTQDRKQLTTEEHEERERMRWSRPKTSHQLEHEQRAEDALERHKKITTDRQNKLTQQEHDRELKRRRVYDEKRRNLELEQARKEKEQECLRSHKMKLFKEGRRRKTAYVRKRSDEERKRAIKLEQRRQAVKETREKKLESRWEQKVLFQEWQQIQERLKKEQENKEMEEKIEARELVADLQYGRQKAAFHKICESQDVKKAEKEEKIGRRLEKKHKKIRAKYERKRKQISAKYKRSGTQGLGQMKKRHHCPMRSSEWEISTCILVDICGGIEDESVDLKQSSQELPAVRRSGSGRTLSWHESMNDLSAKGRLPPIKRSRLFNEEDEEMYDIDNRTPEQYTSDETQEQVSDAILNDDGQERQLAIGACAPSIEIELEEAVQNRYLEFTEDDYNHFMEMGSIDKIDVRTPPKTPEDVDKRTKSPVPWSGESSLVGMSKSDVINGLREAFPSPIPPEGSNEEETVENLSASTQGIEEAGVKTLVCITTITKACAIVQNAVCNAISTLTGKKEYDTATIITEKGKCPDEESIYSIASSIPNYGDDILSARAVEIEYIADHRITDDIPEEIPDEANGTQDDRSGANEILELADDKQKLVGADDSQDLAGDIPEELPETDDKSANDAYSADQVSKETSEPIDDHQKAHQTSDDIQEEITEEIKKEKQDNIENSKDIREEINAKTSDLFCDDESESSEQDEEIGYSLYQPSSILQSIMDIFGDTPPGELRSSSEGEESEEEVEDEDEEEIIGFLENPNIVEETGVSSVADTMTKEKPFAEAVSISGENRVIVEGAIRRASSGDFVGHRGSITEAVLSIQNLSRDSSKRLVLEKVSGKVRSSTGDNDMKGTDKHFEPEEHYHQIIPLYHNHAVDVGHDLIDSNLSAISMKPKSESVHTASRNSFRNIFRPDLTYCEGSAKCLRTTLLRQVSHSSSASSSGSSHHAKMMSVLDQSHHDVTAHHSDEEIVHTDDADGVCMRPKTRAFKVHHVIDDVVKEQDEADVEQPPKGDNLSNNATCKETFAGDSENAGKISEGNAKKEQLDVSRMSKEKSESATAQIVQDENDKDAVIETISNGDKIHGVKNNKTADYSTNKESVDENISLDDQHSVNRSPDEDKMGKNEARVPDSIELKSTDSNLVKLVQLEDSNSETDLETKEAGKITGESQELQASISSTNNKIDTKDEAGVIMDNGKISESKVKESDVTMAIKTHQQPNRPDEANAATDDAQDTVKTKEGKVKRSQRRLSASHSLTGGRPGSSKHHQITQSKSAYSSSSNKHISKVKSKLSGTSPSENGRKQSSSKNNANKTSSSSLKKEHSIILVQPAKEKRSSCTVILTEKRSSQMSARSSTKDFKTPTGAEFERHQSSMVGCDKESPENYKKPTSTEDDIQESVDQNVTGKNLASDYTSDLEKFGRRHSSRIRPAKSLSPSSSTGITYKKKVKTGKSEDSEEVVQENHTEN